MIVPSMRIRHLATYSSGGLWFDEVVGPVSDCNVAVFVKVNTPLLKALLRGCHIRFLLGRVPIHGMEIICLALAIDDIPEDPYYLCRVVSDDCDASWAEALLSSTRPFWIQFFDDTSSPAITLHCTWSSSSSTNPILLPDLNEQADASAWEQALTVFDGLLAAYMAHPKRGGAEALQVFEVELIGREVPEIHTKGACSTILNDMSEGGGFEQQVYRVLYSLFGEDAVRSPVLSLATRQRELTDVLVVHEDLVIAFECKAAAVLNREDIASTNKRAKLVQKQIIKAIAQLQGVARRVRDGSHFLTAEGTPIKVAGSSRFAGICVVSHMEEECDWTEIFREIVSAIRAIRATIQVIDLEQLYMIGAASTTPSAFLSWLHRRSLMAMATGTANVSLTELKLHLR
jgi:hypothetical protein